MFSRSKVPSEEWMLHPQMVQKIWEIFGKAEVDLFALKENSRCPIYYSKDALATTGPPPSLSFSPDRSEPVGNQANQGTGTQGSPRGPALDEPALVSRAAAAAHSSPVAHSPEAGSPLSGEQDDMAPPARAVGPASLATRWEPACLPECVLNTISQARAPATRCLYAIKWSVFSAWCLTQGEDPFVCNVSVTLSFLQKLLDKWRSPSMLKVYVTDIGFSHPYSGPVGGQGQPCCSFSEGGQEAESAPSPHCP